MILYVYVSYSSYLLTRTNAGSQWPKWKKNSILFLVSAYSFLANSTLFGPSIYINYFSQTFQISPSRASQLVSYPNLLFGFGEQPAAVLSKLSSSDGPQVPWCLFLCTIRLGGGLQCSCRWLL